MNVNDFAGEKKVSRQSVYNAIGSGKIIPVLVGKNKDIYIDLDTYADFAFKLHPKGQYPRKQKTT